MQANLIGGVQDGLIIDVPYINEDIVFGVIGPLSIRNSMPVLLEIPRRVVYSPVYSATGIYIRHQEII